MRRRTGTCRVASCRRGHPSRCRRVFSRAKVLARAVAVLCRCGLLRFAEHARTVGACGERGDGQRVARACLQPLRLRAGRGGGGPERLHLRSRRAAGAHTPFARHGCVVPGGAQPHGRVLSGDHRTLHTSWIRGSHREPDARGLRQGGARVAGGGGVMMATLSTEMTVRLTSGHTPQHSQRWLHIVSHTDPRYGGMSSAVPALAASVSEAHPVAVQLAAFCAPGEHFHPAALGTDQVSFWPTSRLPWITNRAWKQSFAELVREADGLHIHGLWEGSTAIACRLARHFGKPYVLSAHGMLEPWALATKRLKKSVYAALVERGNVAGAACLHALTQAEAEHYRSFGA